MPFELTDTQRSIRDVIRDFARREVAPGARDRDESGVFPLELVRRLGALDAMGITVPVEDGGLGLDTMTQLLAIEEIAAADAALASIYTAHLLALEVLTLSATADQRVRYLPALASGSLLAAFALTEPGAGSDIASMTTSARRDGDGWVLRGEKTYISNGAEADLLVVFAKSDPAAGFRGISGFLVHRGSPGLSFSSPQDKCGIRSAGTYSVYFDDVAVGAADVIGAIGTGGKLALSALNRARIDVAAMANGIAARALQLAMAFATSRRQFDTPLRDFQAIQLMLGEMDARLEAARVTASWAAAEKDNGADLRRAGSITKWTATEHCFQIVDMAVQIHGGAGFMRESEIERLYRDSRILRIFEGTSQIQLLTIAGVLAGTFDTTSEVAA
ncbi:MAG TPA: acyl-CoA dehydrogenase family protein [Acidimicrobiales bacterium]|nr:acyl-CoA dehydrogenase family protein [Acidimicrobiales bacterium]